MKKTVDEYKKFALKGNMIDLAIGVVIGGAFTTIINAIVNTVITPLISLLTNKVDLSTLFISLTGGKFDTLAQAKEAGAVTMNYGLLLNAFLNFFIVSVVLFIVVKYIDKIKKKATKQAEVVIKDTTKECPYCLSKVPVNAIKCAYCTSDLVEKVEV
ncbi:MAG: large conductance mechanosensitive channel protein MscL [Clostridia bacterium]|nr:large conductance mechanosensitive channel protein MscL [Clostridia bacterium]